MTRPSFLGLPLVPFVLLIGCSGQTSSKDTDDETATEEQDDSGSDTSSSGPDDAFFEDFERSEADLEHEGYEYYESLSEMAEAATGGSDRGYRDGVISEGGSNVYGFLIAYSAVTNTGEFSGSLRHTWDYPGEPIDLTSCTSGSVSFDWGVSVSDFGYEMSYEAKVQYGGMGESEDYPCTGTMQSDTGDNTDNDDLSFTVECPVTFDCGYESAGVFDIEFLLAFACSEDFCEARDDGYLTTLAWIDNIAVQLEE